MKNSNNMNVDYQQQINQNHNNSLHEHFPNLSQQNFRLYQMQRNITLNLQEKANAYQIQLENAKAVLKMQILAFNNLNSKIHQQDLISKMKESHQNFKFTVQDNQNAIQTVKRFRQQIDQLQEECQQIQFQTKIAKLEQQDMQKQIMSLEKVQERKKENIQTYYKKNKQLQSELDEIHQFIKQRQMAKDIQKKQYQQLVVQLMEDGIGVTQNQNYMIQDLALRQLYLSLSKQVYQYSKQLKNGQKFFNLQIIDERKLREQKDRQVQINLLKQKLKIVQQKNDMLENNLKLLKIENQRLENTFQFEVHNQSEAFKLQLQKEKKIERDVFKGVGLKLISLCNSLKMTEIAQEFIKRHQQIQQ